MRNLAPVPTTAPAGQPSTTSSTTAPTTAATTAPATSAAETAPAPVTAWHPIGTGLRPFEPSDLLQDPSGNAYVFRLTAFEPAHRPPLAEVEPEIVKQLKLAAAYQLAHDQAAKLLTNAQIEAKLRKQQKLPDAQGLPAAAKASGKPLIEAGPFRVRDLQPTQPIPGYDPADFLDKFMFIKAVEDLTKQQTPENLHPSTLIELPGERKVLVAEIGDTVLPITADEVFTYKQAFAPMATYALETGRFSQEQNPTSDFLEDWFELNNVIARVKYVKIKAS